MDFLVIGCGLTGCVIARHLAESGNRVEIWERRGHIGGNMYDYRDGNGLYVHKYGPHVFHTYQERLKKYMLRFARWVDFPITCRVRMLGKETPSPFNFQTIDDYYAPEEAAALKAALLECYPGKDKATIVKLLQSRHPLVRQYAEFLYAHDYSLYTAKQWGIAPEKVDPSVLKRVPVLFSYKDGYFDDPCQMVPEEGYTNWFRGLLDHPGISVSLNLDALERLEIRDGAAWVDGTPFPGKVVYTGAVDELLKGYFGPLPYRSLRFEWQTKETQYFQSAALVAYPEADGFTRITEYSHFPQPCPHSRTSIAYEYPLPYREGYAAEPYYPLLTEDSQTRHKKYLELLKPISNLIICGRLANFQYYNMDAALDAALRVCETL